MSYHQQCTINLLGDLRLEATESAVTQFRTRKIAALLGTLAYHSHRDFRRDELIEMIWPECEPESGRNRLRIALTYLRKDFSSMKIRQDLLFTDRVHVHMDPSLFRTDKRDFEECLLAADAATDEAEQDQHLQRAFILYTGELLPGYDEAWIVVERERLKEAYLRALRTAIGLRARAGKPQDALEFAVRAIELDPLNEEFHRLVMRIYMAQHNTAAALRQYDRLESLLHDQLGIVPSAGIHPVAVARRDGRRVALLILDRRLSAERDLQHRWPTVDLWNLWNYSRKFCCAIRGILKLPLISPQGRNGRAGNALPTPFAYLAVDDFSGSVAV